MVPAAAAAWCSSGLHLPVGSLPTFCIWCMALSLSSCLGLSAFMSESSMSQVKLLKCYLLGACSLSEKSMPERSMSGIDMLLCKCLWMAYPWTCGTQCPTTAWEDVSQRFVHTKKGVFVLGLRAVTCGVWSMLKSYICCGCMWMAYPYQADSLQG